MVEVIKSYKDIRNDKGIIKFSQGDSFVLPFKFNITVKNEDGDDVVYEIPKEAYVKVYIKKNVRFIENILEFVYNNIEGNTIYFELNEEDSNQLRSGCDYVLQAKLFNYDGSRILTLINDLQIKVE